MADAGEHVADRFRGCFAGRVALERDRALAPALAIEARPVVEALVEGLRGLARVDRRAGELREGIAMTSLLGRRAATLGATPTGALAIVPALLDAVDDPRLAALQDDLCAVCIEGYVAASEEALEERAGRRAADAIPVIELAPKCVAIAVAGRQDAAELERVIDELGRRLLEGDARACLVDAAALRDPDPELARRLFAIEETCRMLGVVCVFAGIEASWRRAAEDAGLSLEGVRIEPHFAAALRVGLEACGLELREPPKLAGVLRRLVVRGAR